MLNTNPAPPEAIELPPYVGINIADVLMMDTDERAAAELAALMHADAIGFDTESKPTFRKGEVSTGPHLIQLATEHKAFLFRVDRSPWLAELKAILESPRILKVGFGLKGDAAQLRAKLGIAPQNVLDLSLALPRTDRKTTLGAKTAVAKFFGQKLQKSQRISTTNWATARLNAPHILYAANDAQVPLLIYRAWRLMPDTDADAIMDASDTNPEAP